MAGVQLGCKLTTTVEEDKTELTVKANVEDICIVSASQHGIQMLV